MAGRCISGNYWVFMGISESNDGRAEGEELSVVEGHGQIGRGLHEEATGGPPVPLLLRKHSAQAPQTTGI